MVRCYLNRDIRLLSSPTIPTRAPKMADRPRPGPSGLATGQTTPSPLPASHGRGPARPDDRVNDRPIPSSDPTAGAIVRSNGQSHRPSSNPSRPTMLNPKECSGSWSQGVPQRVAAQHWYALVRKFMPSQQPSPQKHSPSVHDRRQPEIFCKANNHRSD
jgi:hypothetical protein